MPKSSTPITQSDINKLTCPEGRKSIQIPIDPQVPGLLIEIRDTGSKTYFLRYRDADNATRYWKLARSMDITSLADLKKHALKIRSGIVLGNYPGVTEQVTARCITLSEFATTMYLPFAKNNKRSWRDDEKLFMSRIRDRFGHLPLDQISRHSIQQFHGDLREQGLSPATCDHNLGLLSRMLKIAAEDWSLIKENPAKGLRKFNVDNSRHIFLSPEELGRLLTVLDRDSARMPCLAVKLMLFSGSRVGETLHAKWSDIDIDAAVWTVEAENSKNRKRSTIPLGTAALTVLQELSKLRQNDYVFINSRSRDGARLKSIDKVWQRLRVEAGLPKLVLHGTRHHFASCLANAGVDLYQIQKILRHASPAQTQRYSFLSGSVLQDATNSINGYLDKALKQHE